MPATAGFIVGGQHEYTAGSHHLALYNTSRTSIPAGEGSPVVGDCYGPTATYMTDIDGIVYAAANPAGELTMPAGVGLPYPASQVLLFQVHYLNAGAEPISAHVSVHLTTQTARVTQNAGFLFFYDPFIYVPQGAPAIASMRCPIPQDITLFSESSHYHSRGVGYQAYLDPPSGPPATSPFYTSSNWASPTIDRQTIPIGAGSHLRYYCDFDNRMGSQPYVQGTSATANEMCMFVGLYYPAMTKADQDCYAGDTYGTGTVSCTDTLTCLSACPPNDAGAQDPTTPTVTFNSCIQECIAKSCPDAAAPLTATLKCISAQCATPCATPGAACTSCVTSSCLAQYEACSTATCGVVPAAP
jgi:hypothetical protein